MVRVERYVEFGVRIRSIERIVPDRAGPAGSLDVDCLDLESGLFATVSSDDLDHK